MSSTSTFGKAVLFRTHVTGASVYLWLESRIGEPL
jgi:hypothetical protein